ncbi:MAG: hypothetical protein Q9216_003355 [Gyalolechia sp. 2 TL-2023]
MKYAVAALATFAAAVSAQNPEGCSSNFDGTFVIQNQNISNSPGQFDRRQGRTVCGATPVLTLEDGILTDQDDGIGSIVANSQFQFDNPVQEDSLYTSGFSVCQNGSLAVGGSAIFYQCLSGEFYNLYQQRQGAQCNEIYINAIGCEAEDLPPSTRGATAQTSILEPTSMPTGTVMASATSPPTTMTSVPAPYPVGNETVPGTTGTASGAEPSASATGTPAPFLPGSGAATFVIGGNLAALAAAIAAFAMF